MVAMTPVLPRENLLSLGWTRAPRGCDRADADLFAGRQAKHLQRAFETGDAAAQARVADVLGDRAAGRFLLSDAQFVLAQEHGFRTWAEFRAQILSPSTSDDRPVSRLAGLGPGSYASMADALLTDLRGNAPGTLQRLRAAVPRRAADTDPSAAELADARLIIARELGFPTWRELMSFAEKSVRDLAERQEKFRRLRPQAEALLAGDTGRLTRVTAEQADTLLYMLACPEALPGAHLEEELGVPRILSGPVSIPAAGCGRTPRPRAPTPPTSALSRPGSRRPLERGADPSIRDELFQADADGWLHINFATRWHDPVIQQIHDLIESRSR